jgi:hypothetical protein
MAYTTIDKPDDYFNTVLWTGNNSSTGATRSLTGVGFQPDLVWTKNRSNAYFHNIYDSVRGAGITKDLNSDTTNSESDNTPNTTNYGYVSSFDTNGFTVTNGNHASSAGIWSNQSGEDFVAWNWLANGAGVSNTDGSITSTVSASTTSGFSIVSYTGNGVAGATIGHGLGVTPAMMIIKNRDNAAESWMVYHQAYGTGTQYFILNDTGGVYTYTTVFNDTAPDADKFTVGTAGATNYNSQGLVAYCFAEVKGFSKFGSYTGNGNTDGPFVYTGFKPAFVMIKNASAGSTDWYLYDNKRGGPASGVYGNNNKFFLKPNSSAAEGNESFDMYSNGFKIKISNSFLNGSGNTLIYMAFAENPFVTSTSIPTTAR